MNRKRISAFTLFELLMVMILISIIVTILGSTLYNVSGFHKRLKSRVDQVGSFKEVKYLLNRDFNRMKFYEAGKENLIFTNGSDTVFYSFGEQVVRQQGVRVDTISIQGSLFNNDSTTSINFLLGARQTSFKIPSISSGLLSYRASVQETTEEPIQ